MAQYELRRLVFIAPAAAGDFIKTFNRIVRRRRTARKIDRDVLRLLTLNGINLHAELNGFADYAWNEVALDAAYRFVGEGAWKVDLVGAFEVDSMRAYHYNFADSDMTTYTWTAGVRTGYVNKDWALMARANFMYDNSRAFNWAHDFTNNHILNIGFGGFWRMSDYWSTVVTADYFKILDHYGKPETAGSWDLTAGLNLNIDATKYIGAYITKEINHVAEGEWKAQDGMGFGAKFGIDF